MEAEFQIDQRISVVGRIRNGAKILLRNNATMEARRFSAEVVPGRGFGDRRVMRIDRYITVTGPVLRDDFTPTAVTGRTQFWLGEQNVPVWVREMAAAIENTACPVIYPIETRILTEPK
jgi:hypothetical protein